MKWEWGAFFRKLTSRKLWVWAATTGITYRALVRNGDQRHLAPVVVVWGVISVIYLCGEVVIDAMGKAIERAEITLNIGGGIYDRAKHTETGGAGRNGPSKV